MHRRYLNRPQLSSALLLALATAVLTVTFGLIDAALLRPTPFSDSERLTVLYQARRNADGSTDRTGWSWSRIQLLRQSAKSFESLASYSATRVLLIGTDGAERIPGEYVSAEYFGTLGVEPAVGRGFSYKEGEAVEPEIVLGHDFWRNRLAATRRRLANRSGSASTLSPASGSYPKDFLALRAQWRSLAMTAYPSFCRTLLAITGCVSSAAPVVTV